MNDREDYYPGAGIPPEESQKGEQAATPLQGPVRKPKKPLYKRWWFWVLAVYGSLCILSAVIVVMDPPDGTAPPSGDREQEKVLTCLDDFTKYGYSNAQIVKMKTVLKNVGITEITDMDVGNDVAGIRVVKGLAYKDTSFLADANDEVQVTFNIENGAIYLVAIYCPSYYSANKPTYLSGLTNRRADLYYDVEGGYLKKIDWKKKAVVDY